MSQPKRSPIIDKPPFDDADPSGGWGLILLIAILIAVIALAAWLGLRGLL